MRAGLGKDLVALGCVLAAAVLGTVLYLRHALDLGASWTDGTTRYESVGGERIRYAVWDTPEPLAGDVNGADHETRPALSPDGHWLVFAVGERGLNADLYLAELVGGEPRDPRPVTILNTASDELAPAFGPDGLVFASDRAGPTSGLDLYRASFADGVFGPAQPIGSGLNTAADETDPFPIPGTRDLFFSSNRPRGARVDHDLYRATPAPTEQRSGDPDGPPSFRVTPLDALNTPFDEREPASTADGRTLFFASDRERSRGFDLYRTFLEEDGWLAPEPLIGVNTWRSERGPLVTADGFALLFDVEDDEAGADLWRARSKELFRVPTPPLSPGEVLLLLLLLTLALLAWLAKRWRTIDVLYKCFLISLLVHLALLWYLRQVHPESAPVDLRGPSAAFRVRLAPAQDGTPAAARERGGELELTARRVEASEAAPSRAESGAELAAVAPSRPDVAAPERPLEAPARRDAQLVERRATEAAAAAGPALAQPTESFERSSAAAPGLSVDAREARPAPNSEAPVDPNRASTAAPTLRATPTNVALAVERDAAEPTGRDAPGPARLSRTSGLGAPDRTAVAQPSEAFETARATAPALKLPDAPVTVAPGPRRQAGAQARRLDAANLPAPSRSEARPALGRPAELAVEPPTPDVAGPRAPALDAQRTLVARGDPAVDVRAVHETAAAPSTAESGRFDATADLAPSAPARPATGASGAPDRFDVSPATRRARDAAPARRTLAGLAPVADPLQDADQPAGLAQRETLAPGEQGVPEVAVRAVDERLAGRAAVAPAPRRFDPTADLTPTAPRRLRPERPADGPAPRRLDRPEPRTPAASPRPAPGPRIAVADPPPDERTDDRPRRLEHTPYRNRFGEEKLRALEEFGGGAETERAVAAGLAYLAGIQALDGGWGEARDFDREKYRDVRIGKTGLCLLAFLGAGHTPRSNTEYSAVVEGAVTFLLERQSRRSGHFGDSSAYGHGIATYALAECFAIQTDERLRAPLERALAHVVGQQSRADDPRFAGGWGYYFEDGSVWNRDRWPRVSVTAWQVMALESARLGGLAVPDDAFDAARAFLLAAWDGRRGAFRYAHDPSRLSSGYPILPASTPAALFALSLVGVDPARRELAPARRFVLERAPTEYRYRGSDAFVFDAVGNLYFWYYGTLAMFRVGGDEWARWNVAMKDTLLAGQDQDGSWAPISVYSDYAGDDDRERTYSTAMCVLTLEVYYRYFTPLLTAR